MSTKLSNVYAKYIKIGRVVIVFVRFFAQQAIVASDTLFVLPIPFGEMQAVIPTADAESGIGNGNVIYIRNNGECRLFSGLNSQKAINATGAYISES